MGWFKNYFILTASVFAVITSLIWGIYEGGFEPWIVSLLGIVGTLTNLDLLPMFGIKGRILSPEQKIAARDKWRPVFQTYFLETAKADYVGDAIIHDVDRLDTYPDTGNKKGISSWFRAGLMGTYYKGILVGLHWTYLEEENGFWVENPTSNATNSIKVILLGEVPYDCIESVNFDGDDFYNKPHIFCHFDYRGEPYERLFYGEQIQIDPGLPYHYGEISEYKRAEVSRWKLWKK